MPPIGLTKPPLAIDFDGVLNTYASGFQPDYVPDPAVAGALEALTAYATAFQLVIFSTRAASPEGIPTILDWLNRNGFAEIPLVITAEKPNALVYLDDRGWQFPGPDQFPSVEDLLAFHPWWETGDRAKPFPAIDSSSAASAVDSLSARAGAANLSITDAVTRAVEFAGGQLDGLEERVKTPESLALKIAGIMAEKGLDLAGAAADVKDALRYSAVFEIPRYVAAGDVVLDLLERGAGLTLERLRNYWLPDVGPTARYAEGTYLGVNCVFRCPNGFAFELQFHTPQSLDVQALNWDFYRLIRGGGLDPDDQLVVEAQMRQNNELVPVPPAIATFGTLTADATDGVSRGIPASAHYRDATNPDISCATCSYYGAGTNFHCGMWDEPVSPEKTCDDWAEGLPGALPDQTGWDQLDEVTPPALTAAGEPFCLPDELRGVTDPVRMAFVQAVMTPALEDAGLSWSLSNPLAADVISRAGQHIVGISQTTQDDVMNVISYAHDQGLSIPDTAKAIRSHMAEASNVRATMIARTEMAAAVNGASLAAAKIALSSAGGGGPGSGGGTKTWHTAPGATYPRHEDYDDLDGQTVAMDDTFEVGEDQLQYPGDPDGDPGEVINCRCTLTYTGDSSAVAGENMDAAGRRAVDFSAHHARLAAAHKRIDALEEKLVAQLEPVFVRAGEVAARRFEQLATDHLTAAGDWTPPAPEEILPIDCEQAALSPTPPPAGPRPSTPGELAIQTPKQALDAFDAGQLDTADQAATGQLDQAIADSPLTAHDQSVTWTVPADQLPGNPASLQGTRSIWPGYIRATDSSRYSAGEPGQDVLVRLKVPIGSHMAQLGNSEVVIGRDSKIVYGAYDESNNELVAYLDSRDVAETPSPIRGDSELAQDLQSIYDRAEWITPREATDKATSMSASGYMDRYYPDFTGETGLGTRTPVYLQEQYKAAVDAGDRLMQEMDIPEDLRMDVARTQEALDNARATKQDAVMPLLNASQDAGRALREALPDIRQQIAQEMFKTDFNRLNFLEQNAVRDKLTENARYLDLQEKAVQAQQAYREVSERYVRLQEEAAADFHNAQSELYTRQRQEALRVLREVRQWGATNDAKLSIQQAKGKGRQLLEESQKYMPTDWISGARQIDVSYNSAPNTRGWHESHGTFAKIKLSARESPVNGDMGGQPVAIHELGHEVEDTNTMVWGLEKAFYDWRTAGGSWDASAQEDLQTLRSLTGINYPTSEVARPDEFSTAYMGKQYPGFRNYEVLTMGLEGLWTGTQELDAEYLRWLLGVLAFG